MENNSSLFDASAKALTSSTLNIGGENYALVVEGSFYSDSSTSMHDRDGQNLDVCVIMQYVNSKRTIKLPSMYPLPP